jgi:S-adenosyl-L-methionine hydrolase (adenosine-forming)
VARVTLLTDFGTRDGYVGAMKGIIAANIPGVHLDDIGHEISPGDVDGATRALAGYWNLYPGGTVHLVVVDPGVGTARRPLAVEADRRFIVAPDNGVVSRVLDGARSWRAVEISNPDYFRPVRSRTFHGRDVFAPAAAHLAQGAELIRLGEPITDPVRIPEPEPSIGEREAVGEVVHVDRFGNLITNLPGKIAAWGPFVELEGRRIPAVETYGNVAPGEPLALENSEGRLELGIRDGSGAEGLGAGPGSRVVVRREGEGEG